MHRFTVGHALACGLIGLALTACGGGGGGGDASPSPAPGTVVPPPPDTGEVPAPAPPAESTPPTFLGVLADRQAAEGQAVDFEVKAAGTPPVTYQWLRNGTALAGETGPGLHLDRVTLDDHLSVYAVEIRNSAGAITSRGAVLSVEGAVPIIQLNPVGAGFAEGDEARFEAVSTGLSSVRYQWWKDGVELKGQTSAFYAIPAARRADHGSRIAVVASNGAGSTRQEALLFVGGGRTRILAGQLGGPGHLDGMGVSARLNGVARMCVGKDGVLNVTDGPHWRQVDQRGDVVTRQTFAEDVSGIACANGAVHVVTPSGLSSFDKDFKRTDVDVHRVDSAGLPLGADVPPRGGVAATTDGIVFIADGQLVRQVVDGQSIIIAGDADESGTRDGAALNARFTRLTDIAIAADGTIYLADDDRIRILWDGYVSTLYRSGSPARFTGLRAMTIDASGAVHVLVGGIVKTVSGDREIARASDCGAGFDPTAFAFRANGDVWLAGSSACLIEPGKRVLARAGSDSIRVHRDGAALAALFDSPAGLIVTGDGSLVVVDRSTTSLRHIAEPTRTVTTLLLHTPNPTPLAPTGTPTDYSVDSIASDGVDGAYFVHRGRAIYRIPAAGGVTLLAGDPVKPGYVDASGSAARFGGESMPIAAGPDLSVYAVDSGNCRLRHVSDLGLTTTVATTWQFCGDVQAIAVSNEGVVFAATRCEILRLDRNLLLSVAGSESKCGTSIDETGSKASFRSIKALAWDGSGILAADGTTVRRIDAKGSVSTIAGVDGKAGFGAEAGHSLLGDIRGLAFRDGMILVTMDNAVVEIQPTP